MQPRAARGGPLDGTEIVEQPDGALAADAASVDASSATDGASTGPTDASVDRGGLTLPDSAVVACGACVAQSCGQELLTCVASAGCRAVLQCVATTCVSGGLPDPSCLAGCSSDSAAAQSDAVASLVCIVTSCGSECTSVIAGLAGGGAGGGGGGSGG